MTKLVEVQSGDYLVYEPKEDRYRLNLVVYIHGATYTSMVHQPGALRELVMEAIGKELE